MLEFKYTEWSGTQKSDLVYFLAYNEYTRELAVALNPEGGEKRIYLYDDVSREDYLDFLTSKSLGGFFNKVIKPEFGPSYADAPAWDFSMPYNPLPGRAQFTDPKGGEAVISKSTVPPKGGNNLLAHDVYYRFNGVEKIHTLHFDEANVNRAADTVESLFKSVNSDAKVVKVTVYVD